MINYYKVGGCVRDEILGVRSKDIDFAVEAESYEAMRDDILSKGMIIFQERPEYFAIRARHPEYGGVDFTLCRKEGFYSDNRHPDDVQIGTIYDDIARRDFTVNAIVKVEESDRYMPNSIIDEYGGLKDLKNMLLSCVGKTEDRFNEDPLRILRAVRFRIVRGFVFDYEIEQYIFANSDVQNLKTIPLERVYEELNKCYQYDSWQTIRFFRQATLLEDVIFRQMGLALTPRIP